MNNPTPTSPPASGPKKKRLGEELVDRGIISKDQSQIALIEQKKSGKPLGETLITLGFVTESIMRDALGEMLGQSSVDLTTAVPDAEAIKLIPKDVASRYVVVPLNFDTETNTLDVAMSDVNNLVVIDRIRATIGRRIELKPLLAAEGEIRTAIDQFYGYELSVDGILHEIETGEVDYRSLESEGTEYSHPLVRLVDAILADAVKKGASDIHFEPELAFLRLRYRIDGVCRQIRSLHKRYWSAIVVRLKVMSKMNIAETRSPQDGRINLQIRGRQVDFRVSAQPTTHGENIVLRVLDRAKGIVPLDNLGIYPPTLDMLKLMMARPEGIILVTGPTGSGKTTTLYSMLNYIKSEAINIMTLEDPVEYPMDMIRQTSLNEVARMDFANGIRSMMRQDPDVILIGEIRDSDTAEMAFRAAMTGHQVYSTLHTNSAIGTMPRLLDIGVLPDIMSGNIIGVIGQRLVRKLCPFCKTSRPAEDIEKQLLNQDKNTELTLFDAVGCPKCTSGYKGRLSIIEVLRMDSGLDELIAHKATLGELRRYTKANGFRNLADDATGRVLEGITSLDEISRVVDLTDRL